MITCYDLGSMTAPDSRASPEAGPPLPLLPRPLPGPCARSLPGPPLLLRPMLPMRLKELLMALDSVRRDERRLRDAWCVCTDTGV